ncbi:hypothetical protein [Roseateles oligotrophus]|uniref:Transmembrane protein n=1 Tax=Roseateles oligotrophus TaxID=1769250 RepID=A0ABT2YIZ8_9BURK|nr:hypothetical protein [Roseateles oligotrophus]MCV2370038.1 hypothetical protein [Roseateles oligotrophus]
MTPVTSTAAGAEAKAAEPAVAARLGAVFATFAFAFSAGFWSSSQTNMVSIPIESNYQSVVFKHQGLLDIKTPFALLGRKSHNSEFVHTKISRYR